ncbi:glycosyltransferase [Celeribacter sp.]|uniref:glycosyltransferase n=1 Tax=Celeribacter sp. TaxID=1890673 RepID=UPI003A8EE983
MTVGIVLALHKPQHWIEAQLQSIHGQSVSDWHLLIRDDGPVSEITLKLRDDAVQDTRVTYAQRTSDGFVSNFLQGLMELPEACDWAAFSDQDDIWHPDKLARAIASLAPFDGRPALYCSRRVILKSDGRKSLSQVYRRAPSFGNALIENIAPGNTIVLNRAALELARETAGQAMQVFAHDWWLYQLITGVGGAVQYDPAPTVEYRQHDANLLGAGEQRRHWFGNKIKVMKGEYRRRLDLQTAALKQVTSYLTPENQKLLGDFEIARKQTALRARLCAMSRLPVYRQAPASQITFKLALGMNLV